MVMLLAAARQLSGDRAVEGTVHFIRRPAEENEGGPPAHLALDLHRDAPPPAGDVDPKPAPRPRGDGPACGAVERLLF